MNLFNINQLFIYIKKYNILISEKIIVYLFNKLNWIINNNNNYNNSFKIYRNSFEHKFFKALRNRL